MKSRNVAFITSALACTLFAPAISQSSDDWVAIKDPKELRALYSNKTHKGEGVGFSYSYLAHYSADGRGILIAKGKRTLRTWKVKGNDQVCATTASSTVCYVYWRHRDKQNVLKVINVEKGWTFKATVEDGIPEFSIASGAPAQDGHNESLAKLYDLKLPAGPGPHPAVVAISGCSGFGSPSYEATLQELRGTGFATMRVDYVGASEHSRCRKGDVFVITKDQVVADISQAVTYLLRQGSIKKAAINLLGWSYGGRSAFHYLAKLDASSPNPIAAVAAYYPGCSDMTMWTIPTPVLALYGGADTVAPPATCRQLFSGDAAAMIESEEYPGAYHAFDLSNLPPKMEYVYGTIGYQAEAATKAKARLLSFLRR